MESAHRLFTSKGYAGTSIEAIMRDCGLTRGGFYAHFRSKSELYREAIGAAGSRSRSHVDEIESMFAEYLDGEGPGAAQPPQLGFLATDVARAESDVRAAYTKAFKAISESSPNA